MIQKFLTFICVLAMGITNSHAQTFDIHKYLEQITEMPAERYNIGDVLLTEYALIDIDGDGHNELWVRGNLNYQALFTVEGDRVNKIAYADGCTDLIFYKNAVGYSAYAIQLRLQTLDQGSPENNLVACRRSCRRTCSSHQRVFYLPHA